MIRKLGIIAKWIAIVILTFALTVSVMFYLLIVRGLDSDLQSLWVTTAMTTMHHKYLATLFIPEDKINEIMEKNKIDDIGYDSDLEDFLEEEDNIQEPYVSEGYDKLEEGLYLKEVSGTGWRGFVMLVQNPKRVKLVDTDNQFVEGQTVMKMVKEHQAVAGINGGGFNDGPNYDSNGGTPGGLIIENKEVIYPNYETDAVFNMIGINDEGVLILKHCTIEWALENNIVSAVSFSPFLVVNGEGLVKEGTGGWGIAPRTCIFQRETGEILFLVIDGRQPTWSVGVDLDILQQVILEEKGINGAMLDGGSSTAMVYNGDYVNKPSLGHERFINNAFIVVGQ